MKGLFLIMVTSIGWVDAKNGQTNASAPINTLALLFLQGFFYNESQWILNTT